MGARASTTDSRIVKGINWSVNQGADVMNLSLGGPGDSSVLRLAVNRAYGQGVVLVAAAGNEGVNELRYPAAYSNVIAVGATTTDGKLASFSTRGDWVDLVAPGTGILSTSKSGSYDRQSGTSMSTPFVSGLAGLLASQGMTAGSIRQDMQATAEDLGPAGQDPRYGHGRIDAANAVR
jgi:thermitase